MQHGPGSRQPCELRTITSIVSDYQKFVQCGNLKDAHFFGGPILFLLSPEVSGTSGTMSIYIYIYIYVNNMADAKSVQNLSAIFR